MTVKAKARKLVGRKLPPPKRLVALLALSMAGCSTTPRLVETPSVCPDLPARPAQADTKLPEFLPTLNDTVKPADAAGEILRVRVDSAAQYQACRANNDALADWAIRHSKE